MKRKSAAKSSAPPPESRVRGVVYTIAALLCLIGLADATYLTVAHLTGETIACGGAADCSAVLASKYAHVGVVPLAAFGVLAYFSVFSFATFAAFGSTRARTFFSLAVGGMFLATLWLLYVQAFVVHAFCRYCLVSAAITFLLAGIVVVGPAPSVRD